MKGQCTDDVEAIRSETKHEFRLKNCVRKQAKREEQDKRKGGREREGGREGEGERERDREGEREGEGGREVAWEGGRQEDSLDTSA